MMVTIITMTTIIMVTIIMVTIMISITISLFQYRHTPY